MSPRRRVLLVTVMVFINYIDRGNLATAAPLMQDQLGLSDTQLGTLFSAFYFSYVPCMPRTPFDQAVVLASGLINAI